MTGVVAYRCPVDGCSYSTRDENTFIGHMAGTMRADPAHRWGNVPIDHHDLSAARERIATTTLDAFAPGDSNE